MVAGAHRTTGTHAGTQCGSELQPTLFLFRIENIYPDECLLFFLIQFHVKVKKKKVFLIIQTFFVFLTLKMYLCKRVSREQMRAK